MKKINILKIFWFISAITTYLSLVYYLVAHTPKSLLFATGSVSLFMLVKIFSAQKTKQTFVGRARTVYKNKDPKAFKMHLIWYSVIGLVSLVVFIYNAIVLLK